MTSRSSSLFRSAPMVLVQFYLSKEIAHDVVAQLGELDQKYKSSDGSSSGAIQFMDMRRDLSAFEKSFVNEVRRLDEIEKTLQFLGGLLIKYEIPCEEMGEGLLMEVLHREMSVASREPPGKGTGVASFDSLQGVSTPLESSMVSQRMSMSRSSSIIPEPTIHVDRIESEVTEKEREISQLLASEDALREQLRRLIEVKYVLEAAASFFGQRTERMVEFERDEYKSTTDNGIGGSGGEDANSESPLLKEDEDEREYEESSQYSHPLPATTHSADPFIAPHEHAGLDEAFRFDSLVGVLPSERREMFFQVLWRVLKGNLHMSEYAIPVAIVDPVTSKEMRKHVFFLWTRGKHFYTKAEKICHAFGANLYRCPREQVERIHQRTQLEQEQRELETVLDTSQLARERVLSGVSAHLFLWMYIIRREKAIYHTLNMFDDRGKSMIGMGWCLKSKKDHVSAIIRKAAEGGNTAAFQEVHPSQLADEHGSHPELNAFSTPPTHFHTNKFTRGFQEIIDAYGVAKYGEINPTPFTIITFPFLFAIMFGDIGHGAMMTAFALFLVLREKKLSHAKIGEILEIMFDGRYILLLMGIFSIYTGLLYNDLFSRPLEIIPSGWSWNGVLNSPVMNYVYPFGVDPAWRLASNQLIFMNSYKMKMSIVLGVIQMTFGIILTAFNYSYLGTREDIVLMFLPQILFITCIFGYLCVMIILKWCINWSAVGTSLAPNLLNTLIYMFLSPGNIPETQKLYAGQGIVQTILLFVAAICVPWMLLGKPLFILWNRWRGKQQIRRYMDNGEELLTEIGHIHRVHEEEGASTDPETIMNVRDQERRSVLENRGIFLGSISSASSQYSMGSEEQKTIHTEELSQKTVPRERRRTPMTQSLPTESQDMGELMVYQVIHTIEFCLNCISNTASYLRLWALSLAHAQLSEVLWSMVIGSVVNLGIIGMFLGFAVWFVLTIAILLIMESLSAFLHALRLHWVEFNSKFYQGNGYKFEPLTFTPLLEQTRKELFWG